MKSAVLILVMVLLWLAPINSSAQLLKKLKDKVENKVEKTVTSKNDKKANSPQNETEETTSVQSETSDHPESQPKKETTSYTSKFDFIPGENLIISDDFSEDAVGDFPAQWFTNGSGEIVTIEGKEGKWLMLKERSEYYIDQLLKLPDNFTIQFELMCSVPFDWSSGIIYFVLEDISDLERYRKGQKHGGEMSDGIVNHSFSMDLHPGVDNPGNYNSKGYGHYRMKLETKLLDLKEIFMPTSAKNHLKVSIWRQKQRLRVYLNEDKIIDLPKILPADMKPNIFAFQTSSLGENDNYFISNLRIAVGDPDTRNKLLKEGKLVTNGILFDLNSDKIKPESYGILKEISSILKESGEIKVLIVGHTDRDGDETKNLELSQRRAQSVKNALVSDFGVKSEILETSGKGESEPVSSNSNNLNKALNRRVEFLKIN